MSAPRTGGIESGSSDEWYTPQTDDRPSKNKGRGLGDQAAQWPTPQCADGERASNTQMRGNLTLKGAASQWPTPRAEASAQTGGHRGMPDTLTSAARTWPTPASPDWKDNGTEEAAQNRKSPCLPAAVHLAGHPDPASPSTSGKPRDFPTPTANRRTGLQSHGVNVVTGQLNPDWVAQLMGFPADWCHLDAETLSRLTATRSAPTSPKP